jgi:hypothetical protein
MASEDAENRAETHQDTTERVGLCCKQDWGQKSPGEHRENMSVFQGRQARIQDL